MHIGMLLIRPQTEKDIKEHIQNPPKSTYPKKRVYFIQDCLPNSLKGLQRSVKPSALTASFPKVPVVEISSASCTAVKDRQKKGTSELKIMIQ